jgi:farnesyl-diphosphate farnesyltransferase
MSETLDSVETWSGKGSKDENFPVGSVLIRADLRPHMQAFYAFARNSDDIADSPTLAPDDKVYRLDVMEDVLLGRRASGSPSATLLRNSLAQTGVTPDHGVELLVAFRRDAVKNRTADWADLMEYCRYSAMPVGRHVLDLHGESRDTWPASDALCAVLQVVNHLQDCRKDLDALDRSYLPDDRMVAHGTGLDDVRGAAETPALRRVFTEMLDQCDVLNAAAAELPARTRDRRLRLETAIIASLARRLTRRLRNGDPIATRVKLTKSDVAVSVLSALRYLP